MFIVSSILHIFFFGKVVGLVYNNPLIRGSLLAILISALFITHQKE